MKTNKLLSILIIAVFIFSCEVGLGPKLNLIPPETKILEPIDMDNFQDVKGIKGTSSDLELISEIIVSLENTKKDDAGVPLQDYWKKEWIGKNGVWQVREINSSTEGAWQPFTAAKWEGTSFVEWEIDDVEVAGRAPGEYLISAYSKNNVKRESPIAQVRVIIDTDPPVVKINLPILTQGSYTGSNGIEETFNGYLPFNHAHLDKLHNTNLRVQFEVDENYFVDYLRFELRDRNSKVYYNSEDRVIPAKNGSFIINGNQIRDPDTGALAKRTYLRIVSYATDQAGNHETTNMGEIIGSHGWFIWDPDGDLPWSEGLGQKTVSTIAQTQIYTGSPMYGQAYDNESVNRIEYVIYRSASGNGTNDFTDQVNNGILYNTPFQAGDDPSGFFNIKIPSAPILAGNYKIVVTTFDKNGLSNSDEFYFQVYLPTTKPPLFAGFNTESTPTGVYGEGNFDIKVQFREEVRINTSAYLLLNFNDTNTGQPARAVITTSSSDLQEHTFRYTINTGDNVSVLQVHDLVGTIEKAGGGELDPPTAFNMTPSYDMHTRIQISTGAPVLNVVALSGTTLTLTFNKEIEKGIGNILIYHEDGNLATRNAYTYIAPAVISRTEYDTLTNDARAFYYRGTNGTIVSGNTLTADTSEKYILRYSVNAAATGTGTVTAAMKANNKHMVSVPVTNEAVAISSDRLSLVITLTENTGYALPVKGVQYYVNYGAGVVRDAVNKNPVLAHTGTTRSFSYGGVNTVYFRLKRTEDLTDADRFLNNTTSGTVKAIQPYSTKYKIDCQTPVVTINYGVLTGSPTTPKTDFSSPSQTINSPGLPTTITTAYTRNDEIDLAPGNNLNGYICHVAAKAGDSETAYLKATRSVIQYTNFNNTPVRQSDGSDSGGTNGTYLQPLRTSTPNNERLQLWIRGGDDVNGSNSTPGFPISWDVTDLAGAALLTTDENVNLITASGQIWYWISWDVNATAYFRFLAGTTLASNNNTSNITNAKSGPIRWTWCQDRYDTCYQDYPLYPGGSVSLNAMTVTPNMQSHSSLMFRFDYIESRSVL